MASFKEEEETIIKLNYCHAYCPDDIFKSTQLFKKHDNNELLPEITTSIIHSESKLTVIGQNDGKIIYWRPRVFNGDSNHKKKNYNDKNNDSKLVCYKFDGHLRGSVYSLCYGMCNIMDKINNKYGLIISGSSDSTIKIWDPWHRNDKLKDIPILTLNKHSGTVLCIKYINNQLITCSTDKTLCIWMVYLPNSDNHQNYLKNFKNEKLKKIANQRNNKIKNLSKNKQLNIAKNKPISNMFRDSISNSTYFDNNNKRKQKENIFYIQNNNNNVNKHLNNDHVVYPILHCQQIIKFNSWCRYISPSINNKYFIAVDDKGILYSYCTIWSTFNNNNNNENDDETISRSKSKSKIKLYDNKTIFIFDKKNAPIYNIEYNLKLHRLSVIFILFVDNLNYIITLSSDYTMQIHDAVTCAAIFGVKNPENCKYLSADYNNKHKELYVVDENGMLQIWDIRREQCLYAKQLRKSPLLNIKCTAENQITVTASECIEVWDIDRIKRPKNARGHQGDVISVLIIGPSPTEHELNQPLTSVVISPNLSPLKNQNNNDTNTDKLTPEELENNLRNLDTVMYSVGIDNTIRSWDIQTMICRGIFENDNKNMSEISTFIQINGTRALITGHHNGTLFWWNTDNASNIKLPHAHNDAITKIHHYQHNNTEILFSIGQDGLLAVYDIETKQNEKIFHWQKTIVLSEEYGLSAIISDDNNCYISNNNGDIYQYDILMCKLLKTFYVGDNINIIDLQIDSNLLFIACEYNNVIIWELGQGFKMDIININNNENEKCIGLYFNNDSNLLIIVYSSCIVVYDYVSGNINELIKSTEIIVSFTFYNGIIFSGCKDSVISKNRLKSFPNANITNIVKNATELFTRLGRSSIFSKSQRKSIKQYVKKSRLTENKTTIDFKKGNRDFTIKFNKSFGK